MTYHWMLDMSNTTDVTSGTCRNFLLFRSTWDGIGIAQFLVVGVVLCESLFIFLFFSFAHCIIFSNSIYGFWLTLRYRQTVLVLLLIFIITLIKMFGLTRIHTKHTTICETVFKIESTEINSRQISLVNSGNRYFCPQTQFSVTV